KVTRVWDLARGLELQALPQTDPVRVVAFHNGNAQILSAAGSKQVAIDTIAAARVLKAADGPLTALTLTPNATHVLTAGADKQVHLWNLANGAKERSFPVGSTAPHALAISKNGLLLA